jgi:hypothetical protein
MSPTASPFSESMSEYYFLKYVYKYDNSLMVNDRFFLNKNVTINSLMAR